MYWGRNGNENVSNDGPERPDGDDRGYSRKGVEQPTLPSHTRVRDELVRGKRVRPFRLEGRDLKWFPQVTRWSGAKGSTGARPGGLVLNEAGSVPKKPTRAPLGAGQGRNKLRAPGKKVGRKNPDTQRLARTRVVQLRSRM